MNIFNELIYYPLFNLLVFFYNIAGQDIGIAIILLTLLVRFALYPINTKAIKSQKQLQEIQPEMKKVQAKYKDDKEKQAKALMELYQEKKVNPMSGCFPILIQFPILIALYWVFLNGFKDESLIIVYSFITNPGHINPISMGFVNLSEINIVLAVIAGILQYFQTKMLMGGKKEEKEEKEKKEEKTAEEKTQDFAQSMSKQMIYLMPVLTFVFAMSFPSGLALYWAVTTLFAIVQQSFIMRKAKKQEVAVVDNK
ncbi:MAG: YidC/Oxa1 family membrane protein insertase [Candidatus Pacebacteria bacterium]|nr:YidC/Oxa1 family membrane protein insertase [Candidatus Paceibacterota bacterium]